MAVIDQQLLAGIAVEDVTIDVSISKLKPAVCHFIKAGFDRLSGDPERIKRTWQKCNIFPDLDNEAGAQLCVEAANLQSSGTLWPQQVGADGDESLTGV
eukprot:37642-Chlamydomonas_euryale.AAC.1